MIILFIFTTLLFTIGLTGFLLKGRSLVHLLMNFELILLAINTNFILFSGLHHDTQGSVFIFFILTIAAIETAIGLAIVLLLFRYKSLLTTESIKQLRG